MASVPSHLYSEDTLANRVKGHLMTIQAPSTVTHIVTRLDRDTSGVVLFAKHHFAHSVLDKQLKLKQIDKRYVAVASGRMMPAHQQLTGPIGREAGSFIKRTVRSDGRVLLKRRYGCEQRQQRQVYWRSSAYGANASDPGALCKRGAPY
ncbi:pseudouridine synthase [Levilactobacillus brevis]|nr:pseudouridine synthase [Levilactobacillus brevis]